MGELFALAALVVLSATTPRTAWAQRTWGIEASGGWNIYDLSAVNDSIHSLNQAIGSQLGDIHGGPAYAAALRCWANSRLLMRLTIERTSAATEAGGLRYNLGTWNLLLGGTQFFYSEHRLRLGAGIAAGTTWLSGGLTGPQFSLDARGTGPDIRLTGEAQWSVRPGWFLSGALGLRYARVGEIRLEDQPTDTPAELSGVFLRLSIGRDRRTSAAVE